VRIAYDARGLEVTESEDVDLETASVTIVEIIAPESLDIDVSELL
jgi:hypothetical protein